MKNTITLSLVSLTAIFLLLASFLNISNDSLSDKNKNYNTDKNHLLGKINPSSDSLFVSVNTNYTVNNKTIYLLDIVNEAYTKMYLSALKNGVRLTLLSGTRTFYHQKSIWERKWTGKTKVGGKDLSKEVVDPKSRAKLILKYSSMPGTSRHHWGTDIDVYSLNDFDFKTTQGKKVYKWLTTNASKYGFCQPYTVKDSLRPFGYEEEKWHWTYFPISEILLKEYQSKIKYSDISGFKGSETALPLKVIENYVIGINQDCK